MVRKHDANVILKDLSLSVARGEIVGLVGHSGTGKSTLLRIIAGLERPQAGTITIDGQEVLGRSGHVPTERRGVGMVFQDYALFPHLSVLQNVTFGVENRSDRAVHERARAALGQVGLADKISAYPHALSGGEQQRVALVRALLPEPRILLLDEPFSNLDRRNRDTIRDQTARLLRDSGTTAIFVTHEPEDAIRMTDRVMLLDRGRVVQEGTADELYREPASLTVARFFSEYNEIEGQCDAEGIATPLGRFDAPGMAEGTRAVICIRPHDIRIDTNAPPESVKGTVTSHSFVGDEQVFSLWVPGLTAPLQVRTSVHTEVAIGGQIAIGFDVEDTLIFPIGD